MAKTTLRYALIWVLIGLPIEGGAAPFFMGLGHLPGGTDRGGSVATSVSFDGSTVVGNSNNGSGFDEAFRWTKDTGMVGLGCVRGGTACSIATSVSFNGDVVVGEFYSPTQYGTLNAFRWTESTGAVGLQVPGQGYQYAEALDVSADGTVIIGEIVSGGYASSFIWTESTGAVSFSPPGAKSISADGLTVVGRNFSTWEPFRWNTNTGLVGLGHLPGGRVDGEARDVSPDGSVVVGYSQSPSWPAIGTEAFRWTSSTGMIGLSTLPGAEDSEANAVSADGSIIVGDALVDSIASRRKAFIWDSMHGMRSLLDVLVTEFGLNLAGWSLTEATGISGDGQTIVGYGANPDGFTEAWIAYIG